MNTINPEAQQTEHRVTSINIISVPSGMYVDPDAPDRFLTKELDARRRRSPPVTPTPNLVASNPASGDDDKPADDSGSYWRRGRQNRLWQRGQEVDDGPRARWAHR